MRFSPEEMWITTMSLSLGANHRFREKPLAIVLAVVGAAFLLLALVYFIVPAPSLPGLIPGAISRPVRHSNHYTKRAIACLLASGLLFAIAFSQSNLRRRLRHRR